MVFCMPSRVVVVEPGIRRRPIALAALTQARDRPIGALGVQHPGIGDRAGQAPDVGQDYGVGASWSAGISAASCAGASPIRLGDRYGLTAITFPFFET